MDEASANTWDADEWVAWLRRGPTDPTPSWKGLSDCANEIQAEIERLREALRFYACPPICDACNSDIFDCAVICGHRAAIALGERP